jgi:hypothetical protein
MSRINMSNDERLIYVLDTLVLHNVHFRHFGTLKIRFQLIRQWILLRKNFGYTFIGLQISAITNSF